MTFLRSVYYEEPDENGAVLIFVLWIIVLLSVVVLEFSMKARQEVKMVQAYRDSTISQYIAEAALNKAIRAIAEGSAERFFDASRYVKGGAEYSDYVWRINHSMPEVAYGGGYFKVRIGNDSGRINLNQAPPGLLNLVLEGMGYSNAERETVLDSIYDWVDRDGLFRVNGAENDYYSSLEVPHRCRNNFFPTVDDLLNVKGVKKKEHFSFSFSEFVSVLPIPEKNYVGMEAPPETEKKKKGDDGFIVPEYDYSKINPNAASPYFFAAVPGMTIDMVKKIFEYRAVTDFSSVEQLRPLVGDSVFERMKHYLHFSMSPLYTVDVEAWCEGNSGRQHIRAVVLLGSEKGRKNIKIVEKTLNPDFDYVVP